MDAESAPGLCCMLPVCLKQLRTRYANSSSKRDGKRCCGGISGNH